MQAKVSAGPKPPDWRSEIRDFGCLTVNCGAVFPPRRGESRHSFIQESHHLVGKVDESRYIPYKLRLQLNYGVREVEVQPDQAANQIVS